MLVDATNVYTLTSVLDNRGFCDAGFISKTPKAGGTTTPLWSRSKVCPRLLAQSTTWLFFDVGGTVYRLDK